MDDQTMLAAIDDGAVEPDANDASPDSTTVLDASAEAADAAEETPEEVAAREAAELAEKREREAREAAERAAADEAAREERAQAAVEKLSKGAGWAAQAGVYYDATHGAVKATSVPAAKQAARSADEDAPTDEQTEDELVDDLTDVAREGDSLDDIQVSEADAGYIDPVVFGRMVAKVTEAVTRNPLQRELFYKVLSFCQESKPLREIEQMVMALPGFERTSANAYHFIAVMENAGGLERFELDDEGDVVDDARKAGLTEDEIDDLVAEYAFMTTPAGQAVVEQHTPSCPSAATPTSSSWSSWPRSLAPTTRSRSCSAAATCSGTWIPRAIPSSCSPASSWTSCMTQPPSSGTKVGNLARKVMPTSMS